MKYVDLHCHLGSMSTARELWEISKAQGMKLGYSFEEFSNVINGKNDMGNLSHDQYLEKFKLTHKIQSSPLAVEKCVYNAISRSYVDDNVDLIELRFNPMLRNANEVYDLDSVILRACIGMQKAMQVYPVKAGIIISTDRSFDDNLSNILVEKAVDFKGLGVVGFDMSGRIGDEWMSGQKIKDFKNVFRKAKDGGLGVTIHSGEVNSTQAEIDYSKHEMNEIISWGFVDRIGHGIESHKYEHMMGHIRDQGIHLEVCPASNLFTGCVEDTNAMRDILLKFWEHSVSFSLHTDGVVFLNTSVEKEYQHMQVYGNVAKSMLDDARRNSFI